MVTALQTVYVIRTTHGTRMYYAGRGLWRADVDQALAFEFKSIAELYATTFLDLSPSSYCVDLVDARPWHAKMADIAVRVNRASR